MWQKARVVKSSEFPGTIGFIMWVEARRPEVLGGTSLKHYERTVALAFETNLVEQGIRVIAGADCLELLPEFKDEVPLITFEEWLKQ